MVEVVAALFVDPTGTYSEVEGVDCWGPDRDARTYPGPHPVVAHPPCARWGRYWSGGPSARVRRRLGDDGGCFESALASVRRWGGVLEHPEASHAWWSHGINRPPKSGGWIRAGIDIPGWTCCVEQGHYGHRARKATWLYSVRCDLPELRWGKSKGDRSLIDAGYHSSQERAEARAAGALRGTERMPKAEREATPPEFRDALLAMAKSCKSTL